LRHLAADDNRSELPGQRIAAFNGRVVDQHRFIGAHGQSGAELQPAGILKYVEDLKRGPNTEVGPKDFFEIASSTMIFTMILLLGLQPAWHQTRPKNYILVRLLLGS